jgi:hypothetical protein
MKNRRNYYRILHVQPDAPPAVIKATYAALMLKLKHHPDLGGDHQLAALINEAYAVLSDPAARAEYDRRLQNQQSRSHVGKGPSSRSREADASAARPPQPPPPGPDPCCVFCGARSRTFPADGLRCTQCQSPLSPPRPMTGSGADQRSVQRLQREGQVTLVARRDLRESRATIHDVSPTGMCLVTANPLAIDDVVRIDGTLLSAVARVVSCRHGGPARPDGSLVGVEFLTLDLADSKGTFVSRWT